MANLVILFVQKRLFTCFFFVPEYFCKKNNGKICKKKKNFPDDPTDMSSPTPSSQNIGVDPGRRTARQRRGKPRIGPTLRRLVGPASRGVVRALALVDNFLKRPQFAPCNFGESLRRLQRINTVLGFEAGNVRRTFVNK
jgi:hypothetical protein